MKKLNLVLTGLWAVIIALTFTSCGEDILPGGPEISFDQDDPIVLTNTTATITGSIVAEAELETVVLSKTVGGSTTSIATISDFTSGTVTTNDDVNYVFSYIMNDVTENTTFKVRAEDKEGNFAEETIEIQPGSSLNEFTAVLLGAQSNTEPSALDANTGERYSFNESNPDFDFAGDNQSSIDMIYYYGSSNLATIAAPADPSMDGSGANSFDWTESWSTKNATKFGTSSLDFDDADAGDINDIDTPAGTKASELEVGDVIEFVLDDDKKGIFEVAALSTGSDGSITINVKVQE